MVLGGCGEALHQFGGDSLSAVGGIHSDDLYPGHGAGKTELQLPGAAQDKTDYAVVHFRYKRGPVRPDGLGDLDSFFPIGWAGHARYSLFHVDDEGQIALLQVPDMDGLFHGASSFN